MGNVEIRNRIYLSPHGIALEAQTPGHERTCPGAAMRRVLSARRAKRGNGLIIPQPQVAHGIEAAESWPRNPGFAESVRPMAKVPEAA